MDKGIQVKTPAFVYRFFIREMGGAFFAIILGGGIGSILFLLRVDPTFSFSFLIFGAIFALQLILVFIVSSLEYSNLRYLLEQNSLSLKKGVFSVDTEAIPFQKIKNASFNQSIFQRIFGVGNIIIDQDDEKFIWISIDQESANVIMEAVADKSNIQPIAVSSPVAQYPLHTHPTEEDKEE